MVAVTRRITLFSALLLTMAVATALAQPGSTPPDHYKLYRVAATPPPAPTFVRLTDQFGIIDHEVLFLGRFANPAEKEHLGETFPIGDPILHYSWWRLDDRPFSGVVAISNQFGDQSLVLGPPRYLLNPALKNQPGEPPVKNHYQCYECQGSAVDEPFTVTDQFNVHSAVALGPGYFCTPAWKELPDGTSYPVIDPDLHYTCYGYDPADFGTFSAVFTDQFVVDEPVDFIAGDLICLPTIKVDPTPAEKGTWGRLKTMYR